jgi:hypothetical protein
MLASVSADARHAVALEGGCCVKGAVRVHSGAAVVLAAEPGGSCPGVVGLWVGRAGALSGRRGRYLVLVELQEVVGGGISRHSERAADLPRRWKRSIRRLNFVLAKTGSIMALRFR